MKQLACIFFLLITANFVAAQNSAIIKDINTTKAGQGNVTVYEDEAIDGLIGAKGSTASPGKTGDKPSSGNFIQTQGYKIQVYSGNDQRRSKNEASARKRLIEERFPGTDVTITYNSPVWRVRAGNFKSYEEAFEALKEFKNAFPSFGREMQIIKAVVKVPVY